MPKSTPESVLLFIYMYMNHFYRNILLLVGDIFFVHVPMPWFVVNFLLLVLMYDLHDNLYLMDAALLFPYLLCGLNNAHVS